MKTLGLLGGMSWESTATYYRLLNQGVNRALGGLHSAQLVLCSVDFAPLELAQHRGDWDGVTGQLAGAARSLEAAGADFLVIATNTMHKVAEPIANAINIPLLHITDAVAERLRKDGHQRVGLLGTAFTMEQPFYVERLASHGFEALVPPAPDRTLVHRVIYDELCCGQIHDRSRREFQRIAAGLADAGAEAVILGCTEIGLLLQPEHGDLPLYDSTVCHVEAALRWMLEETRQ